MAMIDVALEEDLDKIIIVDIVWIGSEIKVRQLFIAKFQEFDLSRE